MAYTHVSVGNVGQLTVDLIITTLNLKKVASIWHPAIIPFIGGDPYQVEVDNPCTACELYTSEALKIAVIQLRSSIEPRLALDFFALLRTDILNLNISEIVILTTVFAYELHNIESSHFCYISNSDTKLKKLHISPIVVNEFGKYVANGAGFAIKLYELLHDVVKCSVLAKYVSEGDNRPDAFAMMNLIKELYLLEGKNSFPIKIPLSWNYVFGNPPPVGLF
ncbi:PAC2 family [Popillia japonica]|uniref:Proteasome assembly chaperone 2 n=1 Tax=Popillia japonica TaxID=7064 RepID=A0AAW1L5M1_POPJA